MYIAIVKALKDSHGPDLSGKIVPMPANSFHMVSQADLVYFRNYPDVFALIEPSEDWVPIIGKKDASGNVTGLVGPDGTEYQVYGDNLIKPYSSLDGVIFDHWRSGKGVYSVTASGAGTATFSGIPHYPRWSDYVSGVLATDTVMQVHSSITDPVPQLKGDDVLLVPIKLTGYFTQTPPNYPSAVNVGVFVSSDNYSTKSAGMIGYLHPIKKDGWALAVVPCSTFASANGQLIGDKFNWIGVKLTNTGSDGNVALEATVAGIYKASPRRPKLIIQFDDGFSGVYDYAFPSMQALSIPGEVCVIRDRVGTAGYCTEAQLIEMVAAGWNMTVHGDTDHATLGSEAAVLADVLYNQAYVRNTLGCDGYDYVFPAGVISTYSNAALISAGIKTARTTKVVATSPEVDAGMIASPFTQLAKPISNTIGVSSALDYVDAAIAQKSTAILYGHDVKITVVDPGVDISTANWQSLIAEIGARCVSEAHARTAPIDATTMRDWRKLVNFG